MKFIIVIISIFIYSHGKTTGITGKIINQHQKQTINKAKSLECKMGLHEISVTTPIFRDRDGIELMPDGKEKSIFGLKSGEMTEISCFSTGNKLDGYSTKSVNGTCIGGKIKTRKGLYNITRFSCMRPIYPVTTHRGSCNGPKRGRFIDIGYKGDNGETIKGISICHNKERGETYWAYYSFYPKVFKERVSHLGIDEELKIGQVLDIYGSIIGNISDVYNHASRKLSKKNGLPANFVEDILPGFLVPPEDFITYNMQKLSLFYLNTVPQWNSTYNGPWKLIENSIRKKYKDDSLPVDVLVGTHEIKKSPRKDEELWLSRNKVPYPKYLWKAVFRNNKVLVFAIENGPSTSKKGAPPTPFSDGVNCIKRGWNFGKYNEKITCGSFKKLISIVGEANLPHNFVTMAESMENVKTVKNGPKPKKIRLIN